MRKYTNEQIEWVRNNYPLYNINELVKMWNELYDIKITTLRLKALTQNYKIRSGRDGRFTKNHIPYTKGKKWEDYMSPESMEASKSTWFKKEDRSFNNSNHNVVPVGTESLRDGYIIVKLATPTGLKHHPYWAFKHHLIYEQAYGPIPENHVIVFLDGNPFNCDISNLKCIPRDVHVRLCQEQLHKQNIVTEAAIEVYSTIKIIKEKNYE